MGDELLKGISGGQKRRVTAGEMAVGLASVMFLDEVSTGLDSASTLIITKALRNLAVYMNVRANACVCVYACAVSGHVLCMGRITGSYVRSAHPASNALSNYCTQRSLPAAVFISLIFSPYLHFLYVSSRTRPACRPPCLCRCCSPAPRCTTALMTSWCVRRAAGRGAPGAAAVHKGREVCA